MVTACAPTVANSHTAIAITLRMSSPVPAPSPCGTIRADCGRLQSSSEDSSCHARAKGGQVVEANGITDATTKQAERRSADVEQMASNGGDRDLARIDGIFMESITATLYS